MPDFNNKMHQIEIGWGFAPDLTGELTTLPQTPSRMGRGTPPPHTPPPWRLRRLDPCTFGARSVCS